MEAKRVLFLASEPSDVARLRLGREQREIRTALRMSANRDSIEFHDRFAVRPADLTQAIHDVRPHVLHFSGHGTGSGDLCFEDESGETRAVDPEALGQLFQILSEDVEAALLNACYSQEQAVAISQSIPYVIGMSSAIADDAAITFTSGFYKALAAGRSYPESFRFGVAEVRLHGMPDHLTPVLHTRPAPRPAHTTGHVRPDAEYAAFGIKGGYWADQETPGVYIDTMQFSSVRELIETLYRCYLKDRVPPLTYGTHWIITGFRNEHHLVAPAEWVEASDVPAHCAAPAWGDALPVESVGIRPGTNWIIRLRDDRGRLLTQLPFAAVSSDPDIIKILRRDPKGFYILRGRWAEAAIEHDRRTPVVLENWAGPRVGGRRFVDRGGEIPEHARYYLDGR